MKEEIRPFSLPMTLSGVVLASALLMSAACTPQGAAPIENTQTTSEALGESLGVIDLSTSATTTCSDATTLASSVGAVWSTATGDTGPARLLLVTSCDDTGAKKDQITLIDPRAGVSGSGVTPLVKTVTTNVATEGGWGGFALRPDGTLVACENAPTNISNTVRVYVITPNSTSTWNATLAMTANIAPADSRVCDGLAWDATDGTLYMAIDGAADVFQFDLTAASANPTVTVNPLKTIALDDGCTAASIMIAGDNLIQNCDFAALPATIRVRKKSDGTQVSTFTTNAPFSNRPEDMECDPLTFAATLPAGQNVVWTRPENDTLIAIQVSDQFCNLAGLKPTDAPLQPTCGAGPVVFSSATDQDNDGLLDCWEKTTAQGGTNYTVRWVGDNGNGIDLSQYPGGLPRPGVPDIYLELDTLVSSDIDVSVGGAVDTALTAVTTAFASAPGVGVNLHVALDEDLATTEGSLGVDGSNMSTQYAFSTCTLAAANNPTNYDFLKQPGSVNGGYGFRNTVRNSQIPVENDPTRLKARGFFVRYGMLVNSLRRDATNTFTPVGCAELVGDDLIIPMHIRDASNTLTAMSMDEFKGTLMHELGHNLGLQHGGAASSLDYQPNYLSVMSNGIRGTDAIHLLPNSNRSKLRNLDFSRQVASLNEAGLVETAGIPGGTSVSAQPVTVFFRGGSILHALADFASTFSASYSGNCVNTGDTGDGTPDPTTPGCTFSSSALTTPVDLNNNGVVGELLPGAEDWSKIRVAIDQNLKSLNRLPGIHFTSVNNVEIGSEVVIARSADSDGDGVKNVFDNAPTVSNPDQKDTDKNGVGDATQCADLIAATPAAMGVKLQYHQGDHGAVTDTQIKPQFKLFNTGTSTLDLRDLTVRYWYTNEGTSAEQFFVDFAPFGITNVTGKFVRPALLASGSNSYTEIGFTLAAGTLAPGAATGEIQTRFNRVDFTNFNEADDYSYGAQSTYIDWAKITVYRAGVLVWGKEPVPNYCTGGPATATPELKVRYRVGDPGLPNDVRMRPVVEVVNLGANTIPISDLKVRYWYTQSGTATQQFFVDLGGSIGSSHLSGQFVTLSPTRPGANRYLEVHFDGTSGSLIPGADTGELQLRVQQSNGASFAEGDDYSYDATKTALADWTHVTLYRNGVLVWGQEP